MAKNPFLTSPFETVAPESDFTDVPMPGTAAPAPAAPVPSSPKAVKAPVAARGTLPTTDDIIKRAAELNVDPKLALSFFAQESSANWNSKDSPKGARGGMQVMPGTYKMMMGTEAGQNDPWNNLEAGLRYIRYGQDKLKTKDPALLAAGYHAGYDHPDLKQGRIPNTNDGMISTREYARSMANRVGGNKRVNDEFEDVSPGKAPAIDGFEDVDSGQSAQFDSWGSDAAEQQKKIDNEPYLDRAKREAVAGYDDMTRSLLTARWALGAGDDLETAEELAKNILKEQQPTMKPTAKAEIDAAYEDVSKAEGVVDTTVAGAKALYKSLTNPKETSLEIIRSAANSLPTLATGAAGAGGGALAGAPFGGVPGAITGAIVGGRTGMAAGTTATELGAEIQYMVRKRLEDEKIQPTAQNVLAILKDEKFKSDALEQGFKKGLTVAAIDQIFMGIGGKIATAPARKEAMKALGEQGVDVSTSKAAKQALASPAGRAAVEAAKPSIGARVGAGAAAIGVDAAGESIGEGTSQFVARGEVDYGDALREGVTSLGQSAAQTAAGVAIERGKQAIDIARSTIRPTQNAPSEAAGPLARAAENAAAQPDRVTVKSPEGEVSGTVTGQSEDGKVQIVSEDGEVLTFDMTDGRVTIEPEAPNTPLSNALDVASEQQPEIAPEVTSGPAIWKSTDSDIPVEVLGIEPEPGADGKTYARVRVNGTESFVPAGQLAPAPKPSTPPPVETAQPAPVEAQQATKPAKSTISPPPDTDYSTMAEPALRDRLRYIKSQGKPENGGWTTALIKERKKVEKAINALAKQQEEVTGIAEKPASATVKPVPLADEPPLAKGMIRLYHGSAVKGRYDGPAWFSTNRTYAANYRPDAELQYVDMPADRINGIADPDGYGQTVERGFTVNVELDSSDTGVRLPLIPSQAAPEATDIDVGTKPAIKVGDVVKIDGKKGTHTVDSISENGYVNTSSGYGIPPAQQEATAQETLKERNSVDELMSMEQEAGQGFKTNPRAVAIIKKAAESLTSENKTKVSNAIKTYTKIERDGTVLVQPEFYSAISDSFAYVESALRDAIDSEQDVTRTNEGTKPAKLPFASKEDTDRLFGVDAKRQKAMERIAKGTAYFGSKPKADEFITKNGLKDTHTVAKGKAGRWDIVAKEQSNVTDERTSGQPASTEAVVQEANAEQAQGAAVQPAAKEEVTPPRQFNVIAVNEKTGDKTMMTKTPVTQDEGVTMMSKISSRQGRRIQLEEVQAEQAAKSESDQTKKTPLQKVEAELADWKSRRELPVNANQTAIIDEKISELKETVATLKTLESPELTKSTPNAEFIKALEVARKELPDGFTIQPERNSVALMENGKYAVNGLNRTVGGIQEALRQAKLRAGKNASESTEGKVNLRDKATGYVLNAEDGTQYRIEGIDIKLNMIRATRNPDMLSERVELMAQDRFDRLLAEDDAVRNPPRTEPTPPTAGKADPFAGNKIFTSDKVEAAKARLKQKLSGSQLNSGIDPELLMDGITIAGAYVESGVRNFTQYATRMVDDLGDGVKPYLLSFWEATRNYPGIDNKDMTSVEESARLHAEMVTPEVKETAKESIGEVAEKPAKRTKKTGAAADMTLTQDWGVDHVDGYGDSPNRETGNSVKDAFLKESTKYMKAAADILTQRGFMPTTDRRGMRGKAVSTNESGAAVSGDVSLALFNPEIGVGVYANIGGGSLRGVVPSTPSGVQIMFRATSKENPYGALGSNRWAPVTMSAAEFADMMEKEARRFTKENDNGSEKLDQPGARALEGAQPELFQGAQPDGQAGDGAARGGRADAPGNERAGGTGVQQSGSVGNDTRGVPATATGAGSGRSGQQGGGAVSGGQRAAKPDPVQRDAGNQPSLIPESGTRAQDRADGFVITDEDAIGEGGAKTKYKQNVAAIRLLKQLTAENRQATRAEQAVLAKYVGWGGIPQAFYRDNNEVTKGWEKEAAELKELMTADELDAAAKSTRNAHYTSPEIVGAVWEAAKRFGFTGGRTLEPSVGVGNFFGLMPTDLRSNSQLTGVELDHITGGIAKQLYPNANIQAPVGFQDFSAPDNYFDLAIGNPPFGREGIYDPKRRKISGFSIHNYFFAKSIDTVKPNGVLAMVVTNRLLDSVGDKSRQYIAERSEFLGAIRLPNDAFLKNAGTQVTTDIIFLRKLKEGEQPTGARWMEVKQYKDANGKFVPLNEYFLKNPGMMLGEFGQYGSMYSDEDAALVAKPGQDTMALLKDAIAQLPQGFMDAPSAAPVMETIEPKGDISAVKVGSIFEQGGQIYERREDMLGKQQMAPVSFASDKAKERVSGMIKVRDALIDVRRMQLQENVNEAQLEAARADLNKAYDAFVKANGPLNADANKRLMRDDPSWPQIAALEDDFDKGISATVAKNTGEKARAPSAKKAAIFKKRTQSPYKAPEKASSAKDAMVSSLAELGRVDLDYMASLYGKTPEAIDRELEGLIYKNPTGGWEAREQYLSGNVKKKLAQAIEAANTDPAMKANVEALKAVQPVDIEAVDIDVKTGAHWVPADVMTEFVETISEGRNVKTLYNPITASWTFSVDGIPQSASTQWGTDRAGVTKILEAAANQKQITLYDEMSDGTRVLNEAATTAANQKVERVKAEWKNWIWNDDARRVRLARIYNDTFNTDVQREFDGSHLKFPGKVGDDIISLRPHQANAIWRMVQSSTTLLDHVVGAGKTFTMIGGIMEMRRMGIAKKPILVVPNHLVGQWAVDFMKLYPGANILAATKKDFEKDNRKKLFARIATGDWDAVIIAHSSFGKVEVEPEFQEAFIKQQIADMDTSISAMRAAEGKSSRNVKQIEKQKAALEEKLKKLFDTGSKDDNLYFSELGIDAVLVDEAHEFKNLGFSTGMQRVAGLGNPSGSNKAADMFMKVQATLKRTGGRNVVFATGTPISNTMAEMYTMQRFLDYQTLKDQGIAHFDAWAKTFGEVVTDWELSPSGQYKMNSRFAKFVNMPELMQRYQSFADVVNRDDINRMLAVQGKKLPVPKIKGGKPENTVVPRSDLQASYIGIPTVDENGMERYPEGSLVYRAENIPKKAEKGADNMLKIMSDARKAALDMRLIDPSYPDNPGSKVNVSADNIKDIYDQWSADKGTQLVFIDLSTPKNAKGKEAAALREIITLAEQGDEAAQEKLDRMSPDELLALDSQFSVYDDLKQKLIDRGIPENEIAFIHDAGTEIQKEDLFGKVRSGRVRVLFGSTAKMGAGMNVQDRLVALHHLDAPWRPSDLEQREGRIIRQGNKLYEANPEGFEIRILRYATKQTLDSRMWQTIEAKARFIEQVRKGSGAREVEDVAGEAANSAEMKAASSGNPLILEEMTLRQTVRKLENQQSEHNREQYRIKDRIRSIESYDRSAADRLKTMAQDVKKIPEAFLAKVGNESFDKHGKAGEAILAAMELMHRTGVESREIGSYGGFKLKLDDTSVGSGKSAVLSAVGTEEEYQVSIKGDSDPTGLALRLQNLVKSIPEEIEIVKRRIEANKADIPKLQAQIGEWKQAGELAEAKQRHAEVIEQLRPKKKEQPAKEGENPALSRSQEQERMRYIDDNFYDILGELEDSGKVTIKC